MSRHFLLMLLILNGAWAHAESNSVSFLSNACLDLLGMPLTEGHTLPMASPLFWMPSEPVLLDAESLRRMLSLSRVGWEPGDEITHDLGRQTSGKLGSWTCWTLLRDPRARRDDPLAGGWRTDDSWKMEVIGPLFVFGKLEAGSDGLGGAELSLNGRTGLGCKWVVPLGAEVTLRGGPSLSYNDTIRSEQVQEKSELFFEVLARYPLPLSGQVGLEYVGAAVPALNAIDSHRVNQELRFAIPVGDSGLLKVGAKHQWDETAPRRDWRTGMQVFLGLEVKPGVGKK